MALDQAWNAEHPVKPDPRIFRDEILPELTNVSLGEMAAATGLSKAQCSAIRRGLKVPHPRHWESLAGLGALPVMVTR